MKLLKVISLLIILISLVSCSREGPGSREGIRIKERIKALSEKPTTLQIYPKEADSRSTLTALLRGTAQDRFRWMKNGEEIKGEVSSVLSNKNFQKGDTIYVNVTVGDKTLNADPVIIKNSPPTIISVAIEPKYPTVKDTLKARIEGADFDGDSVIYHYKWLKNGEEIKGATLSTLTPDKFSKGDAIALYITPDDGETKGETVLLNRVIQNAPPLITSTPSNFVGDSLSYQIIAEDPDGDSITYKLIKGPIGMLINPETGFLQWAFTKKDEGSYKIEIEVEDKGGEKDTQEFDVAISFPEE